MNEFFCYTYFFILGTIVASFVNVIIYRIPKNIDYIKGRSFCPNCQHQLSFFDLIPIISYILLKGKCRYCHQHISICDTLFEICGGFVFIICFYCFQAMGIFYFLLIMLFVSISIVDIKIMEIPYEFMVVYFILSFIYTINQGINSEHLLGIFILTLPLILMNTLKKDCIGGGDIIFLGISGFMLGCRYVIIGMIIAVLLASFYALIKMLKKKDYIAFAPFLCLGMFISLLWGEPIFQFYVGIFL
ncbi:MAG: prepilin peptidase [Erysipelotrichales bacterium]|nr:prepilin peptidase [Erysipelotrichales bacterium]